MRNPIFYVLQHVNVIFLHTVKKIGIVACLKTSLLIVPFEFFYKKVVIMFGQFVESIYLCIRNREGHPLRLYEERVL